LNENATILPVETRGLHLPCLPDMDESSAFARISCGPSSNSIRVPSISLVPRPSISSGTSFTVGLQIIETESHHEAPTVACVGPDLRCAFLQSFRAQEDSQSESSRLPLLPLAPGSYDDRFQEGYRCNNCDGPTTFTMKMRPSYEIDALLSQTYQGALVARSFELLRR
jgi:hypothetical protein